MDLLRIGYDFDGIVVDGAIPKCTVAKEMFGVVINPDRCRKEFILADGLLTKDQYVEVQRRAFNDPEVVLPLVPGALEFIPRIHRDGHFGEIATARVNAALENTRRCCRTNGLDFLDALGVGQGVSKAEVARQRRYQVFWEDDVEAIDRLHSVVPHRFLRHCGYNAHEATPKGVIRVSSWAEFYGHICRIAGV